MSIITRVPYTPASIFENYILNGYLETSNVSDSDSDYSKAENIVAKREFLTVTTQK